jgi:hypothetical protein
MVDRHVVAQLRRLFGISAIIAGAAALLAGGGVTAPGQGLLAEKAALEAHAAAVQAFARAREALAVKPADPAAARPPALRPEPSPEGLVELPSPFPTREYLLEPTGWQRIAGSRRLTVYAGALGADRARGVLLVVTTALPSADERIVAPYPAPSRNGSLQLVAARGDVLVLRDESGGTLSFDVSARRYMP